MPRKKSIQDVVRGRIENLQHFVSRCFEENRRQKYSVEESTTILLIHVFGIVWEVQILTYEQFFYRYLQNMDGKTDLFGSKKEAQRVKAKCWTSSTEGKL